jgi:hypothetical protein
MGIMFRERGALEDAIQHQMIALRIGKWMLSTNELAIREMYISHNMGSIAFT